MYCKIFLMVVMLAVATIRLMSADENPNNDSRYITLTDSLKVFCLGSQISRCFFGNLSEQEIEVYCERCEKSLTTGHLPSFPETSIKTVIENIENHQFWKTIKEISFLHGSYLRQHKYPQVDNLHIVAFVTANFIETFIFPKMFRVAKDEDWDAFEDYFQTVALSVSPNSPDYYILARKLNTFLPIVLRHCLVPDKTKVFIKNLATNIVNDLVEIKTIDTSRMTEYGKKEYSVQIEEFKRLIKSGSTPILVDEFVVEGVGLS